MSASRSSLLPLVRRWAARAAVLEQVPRLESAQQSGTQASEGIVA